MSERQVIGGRFEIADPERDLLGRGGMGDVYRGTDTQTGDVVAIKALRPEVVSGTPDAIARFIGEGEALRELNHPNIVHMVEAVEDADAGRHYLVIEYVPGGSLRDLLEGQGRLPIKRTVEIALDVADALTRAHRIGIIHRDLKPANVLLAADETARLTDFGIAQLASGPRLTGADRAVGTVDYMSPEACNLEPLDRRTDVWSFGVMLYEMLAGQRPFAGDSPLTTLTAILTRPVPDLAQSSPGAPDGLIDLVYRMLEKDRSARIPSVRMVGTELEAILEATRLTTRGGQQAMPAYRPSPAMSRFATPTPAAEAPKHNLPVQPTPFVGREAELAELERLLSDPGVRLVTVLGAGGMGKTRLALEAARRQMGRYAQGVYFGSLAPLRSVEGIVPTIASSLGLSFYAGGTLRQQLLDYLRDKHVLLLLDNYEHLLHGVDIIADILRTAPKVNLLTTSRARLNVRGEQLFHLAGMEFPDWETPAGALEPAPLMLRDASQYSAVKLFLQSARRVQPGFELQSEELRYVARICRLVEGMPLGILLAAAWIEMLTPAEIAAEISQSLDFLETELYDVPRRQRSMRAVFDHSWNLLSAREREVFQVLSVFRGGFAREAAQQVTNASLRELMTLVNKSLLHRTPGGRYEVHELLRQYAAERLAQSPGTETDVRDQHSAYYAAALQRWAAELKSARQQTALAEMRADFENARAGWDWSVEQGQVGRIEQALEGLTRYYEMNERQQEGETVCRLAAQMIERLTPAPSGDERRVWARILARQGSFSLALGHTGIASQLMRQSLALLEGSELADLDTRAERAFVLATMGGVVSVSGDVKRAMPLYEQSLALYQALDDRWRMAEVQSAMGYRARNVSNYGKARQFAQESLALYQALGDRWKIAGALYLLGSIARAQGQLEEAERLEREEIRTRQESGLESASGIAQATRLQQLGVLAWPQGQLEEAERLLRESIAARLEINPESVKGHEHTKALLHLGWTLVMMGRFAQAHDLFQEALATSEETGRRHQQGFALSDLGFAKLHLGQYRGARAQAQMSLPLAREIDIPALIGRSLHVLGAVALAGETYAQAHQLLQESVAVYREVGAQERLAQALAVASYAARWMGDVRQAEEYLFAALSTVADIGALRPLVYALPAIALLLVGRGQQERAIELYALASGYPFVANSRWFEDVAGVHITAAAATLPPDVVTAVQKRGRSLDPRAMVEDLMAELGTD